MLEFRLVADAKRIAALRGAIRRECGRAGAGAEHADTVVLVAEHLVAAEGDVREGDVRPSVRRGGRASEVLVIVSVQSDATMLMVRDARPELAELGDRRQAVLKACTERWSTISGRDGRTIWAEIARVSVVGRVREQIAAVPSPAAPEPTVRTSRLHQPIRLRVPTRPTLAPSD
jgi:hypothetical protein